MNLYKRRIKSFHSKYKETDKCWLWKGTKHYSGYGTFRFIGQQWRVHRLMWTIKFGTIPKNIYVLHKCDVKNCVNPRHLFLGTAQDNINDCILKGRFRVASGKRHGSKTHPEKFLGCPKGRKWKKHLYSF